MSRETIKQAISLAKSGNREDARDLLLSVVEADENNEVAWLWLSNVVDSDEDRIIAIENALTINPDNEKARQKLNQLKGVPAAESTPEPPPPIKPIAPTESPPSLVRAIKEFKDGDHAEAKAIIEYIFNFETADDKTWRLYSRVVDSLDEEINALENALRLRPGHEATMGRLNELHAIAADPEKRQAYDDAKNPTIPTEPEEPVLEHEKEVVFRKDRPWEREANRPWVKRRPKTLTLYQFMWAVLPAVLPLIAFVTFDDWDERIIAAISGAAVAAAFFGINRSIFLKTDMFGLLKFLLTGVLSAISYPVYLLATFIVGAAIQYFI